MKRVMIAALVATFLTPVIPAPVEAGPISSACNRSDRKASTPRLCRCIQAAANRELTRADQRLAAKFFRDPHHAQEIRQSDRVSHERFWVRYKRFGTRAEQMCG